MTLAHRGLKSSMYVRQHRALGSEELEGMASRVWTGFSAPSLTSYISL